MIETRMPKDIRVYETKIIGPFTTRNIISLTAAVLLDLFLYKNFIAPLHISANLIMYILIVIDLPILAVGFIKIYTLPFEKYIFNVFIAFFIAPKKRKAKNEIIKREKKVEQKAKSRKEIAEINKYLKENNILMSK